MSETLAYTSGESPSLTTASEYVFTINAKSGANYSNAATVHYGLYSSGSDVMSSLTSGSGIVSNSSIKVQDSFQSVSLSSIAVSTSGKLTVGTYNTGNAGFIPIISNIASPKGTSMAEDATTTSNYDRPSFALTISQKPLTATATSYSVTAGSSITSNVLSELIGLDSVYGDEVAATITSMTLAGITYDLTVPEQNINADVALTALVANSGEYAIDISYSSELTGSDAGNYTLVAGAISNAKLYAIAPYFGGGGGGSAPVTTTPAIISPQTTLRFNIGSTNSYLATGTSGEQLKLMDIAPVIYEERTLLPIRFVVEPLGGVVTYSYEEQKVTVVRGITTIELWIGNNMAKVNGVATMIDPNNPNVKPIVIDPPGRTMMPLRFISEALGCTVEYSYELQQIFVKNWK